MNNGFLVIDADRHVMEPGWLWDRYLQPQFRGRVRTDGVAGFVDGEPVYLGGGATMAREDRYVATFRDGVEHEFDAPSNLRAMDREGVDLAVHFPSNGL